MNKGGRSPSVKLPGAVQLLNAFQVMDWNTTRRVPVRIYIKTTHTIPDIYDNIASTILFRTEKDWRSAWYQS